MENSRNQFRSIYLIGAIATIIVLCGIVLDMIVGSIVTGGDISSLPQTAIDRFNQFKNNWILGLYSLDLLNVIIQIITIPSIFAIYIAHKRTDNGYALLALILFLIGTTVFISGNIALPMFELSEKYFSAISDAQKNLIAAAGESMLAKGTHGSLGVFIGFALPTFSSILISHVMIKGQIFTKATSYIGFVGNILLLLYIVLVTFYPATEKVAVMIAMPGGLLVMAWMITYMIKLFKLRLIRD
ncbi:MAG: DUF4386 family protein [Salinivirgaceae bacterium]|jgi:hypothetical protein|nr:DUF4386 family protein [Salinivirgaceae bacterium]